MYLSVCAEICWINSTDMTKNTFHCMSKSVSVVWMNILYYHGHYCVTIPGSHYECTHHLFSSQIDRVRGSRPILFNPFLWYEMCWLHCIHQLLTHPSSLPVFQWLRRDYGSVGCHMNAGPSCSRPFTTCWRGTVQLHFPWATWKMTCQLIPCHICKVSRKVSWIFPV